jgi:two-component system OmpR family response regulator
MIGSARILVVDDEPDTLGLIELTLQTAGYQVKTAANGEQALSLVRQDTYDLVLQDVMMPDLSGFDVLRILNSELPAPPAVVFLTAKNREEDRRTGKSLGAVGYLAKPTTRGQLLDAVHQALGETASPDAPA